jgi:hypothetical protein
MLKSAFNSLTKLHGRDGQLRRPGNPDIYSPCRITPSNYFRFLRGPESTVIHGREFIIPIDTMLGQFSQSITFVETPTAGTFKLSYNGNDTSALAFNASAATIQTALRLLAGLSQVLVTGSIAAGLTVVFAGFSAAPLILVPTDSATLLDASSDPVTISVAQTYQLWSPLLKRGDKLVDSVYGSMTIDEIMEAVDLGGAIMGFRVRAE